jgi:hypothetical protein
LDLVGNLLLTRDYAMCHLPRDSTMCLPHDSTVSVLAAGPRVQAKLHEYRLEGSAAPWAEILDTLRLSLVSTTLEQQAAFIDRYFGSDELRPVRAKSTMEDSTSSVKQVLMNLEYTPVGLTFGNMVGGLTARGADRWEVFGDVQYHVGMTGAEIAAVERGETGWTGFATTADAQASFDCRRPVQAARNRVTVDVAGNGDFTQAVAAAKADNPQVSGYVWAAAVRLLGSDELAAEQVAMVIECQFYIEQLLAFRKAVHGYYTICRATGIEMLAQDCQKHALNQKVAYSDEKAAAAAAMAGVPGSQLDGIDNGNGTHGDDGQFAGGQIVGDNGGGGGGGDACGGDSGGSGAHGDSGLLDGGSVGGGGDACSDDSGGSVGDAIISGCGRAWKPPSAEALECTATVSIAVLESRRRWVVAVRQSRARMRATLTATQL